VNYYRRDVGNSSRDEALGADGSLMEVAEFVDDRARVGRPLLVSDPIDLPSQPSCVAVPDLVVLCLASSAMPSDMVDLDAPPVFRVGAIEMDE
jgi:hypothetical protein